MASNKSSVKRLYRSEKSRVLGGVARGIGEYFDIDPTLIRIIFVIITLLGGSGILIYLILWLVIPTESDKGEISDATLKANVEEIKNKGRAVADELKVSVSSSKKKGKNTDYWWGVILVVVGGIFLLSNLNFFSLEEVSKFWPLILIALGFLIIAKR